MVCFKLKLIKLKLALITIITKKVNCYKVQPVIYFTNVVRN